MRTGSQLAGCLLLPGSGALRVEPLRPIARSAAARCGGRRKVLESSRGHRGSAGWSRQDGGGREGVPGGIDVVPRQRSRGRHGVRTFPDQARALSGSHRATRRSIEALSRCRGGSYPAWAGPAGHGRNGECHRAPGARGRTGPGIRAGAFAAGKSLCEGGQAGRRSGALRGRGEDRTREAIGHGRTRKIRNCFVYLCSSVPKIVRAGNLEDIGHDPVAGSDHRGAAGSRAASASDSREDRAIA